LERGIEKGEWKGLRRERGRKGKKRKGRENRVREVDWKLGVCVIGCRGIDALMDL